MKLTTLFTIVALTFISTSRSKAQSPIDEYNNSILVWGTSWKPGEGRISYYYPSFYTGFAPRSEFPNRIHIRTSRGNQTRVSVILDDKTLQDYLYDLVTRLNFYEEMTTSQNGHRAALDINPDNSELLPQLENFKNVVTSPVYGIQEKMSSNNPTSPLFYQQSVEVMKQLNPGRVFEIRLNLNNEFAKWKDLVPSILNGQSPEQAFTTNSEETIKALNSLVWGRVNYTETPSTEVVNSLQQLANLVADYSETAFLAQALELFKEITSEKYDFKTVDNNGQWIDAINCAEDQCWLNYYEFTTIYPTGSLKSSTRDRFGNRIPQFATPGLWPFLDRGYHEVDHIRREPYYGWAPKMDFEAIGNGFHNPAVRFAGGSFSNSVKELLMAPTNHTQLWAVKRGGVSSGCLRLPLGHVWEMRHIMPVENEKMKQVYQFGNDSEDFDLYDIDGDGNVEVMGVEYMISYDTQGSSGLSKRDGKNLNIAMDDKYNFYEDLYGQNNVFQTNGVTGQFEFLDPKVSMPSHLDLQRKRVRTSMEVSGIFPLYEQTYERDKVQFYSPITTSGMQSRGNSTIGMRLVRLMGRVKGCAPTSNSQDCGSAAFEQEKSDVLNTIY